MVVTNQPVRCRTIEDALRTLRIVSKEEGIRCLRDIGIVNGETYTQYMNNLDEIIKKEEKRIKELRAAEKSLENKQDYLTDALFGLALGTPLVYAGYEFLKNSIGVIIEYSGNYGLGAWAIGIPEGIIGGLFSSVGLLFIHKALKNIANYVDARNIEKEIGKRDLGELREEIRNLEKDINKKKELYGLLLEYSDYFLRHY